jgi:shikimate kinase
LDRMTDTTVQTQAPTASLAAEPLGRHVALLGLMGTGKTAVGTQLASTLGVGFDDNDNRLAAASGLTPRELRNRDGIAVLHSLEAKHFLGALRSPLPGVVSAAASVVEDSSCRDALRNPEIRAIWLRVEPATLAARFHREAHRPIYSDDLQGFLSRQLAARGPLYQEVSDSVIDTDGLTIAEIVELLLPIVDQHLATMARLRSKRLGTH